MRSDPHHKPIPFWKQDILALFATLLYLLVAIAATHAWSRLSDQANAFASDIAHIRK
jgi:biopolymer transport protein ExbB/TolQ